MPWKRPGYFSLGKTSSEVGALRGTIAALPLISGLRRNAGNVKHPPSLLSLGSSLVPGLKRRKYCASQDCMTARCTPSIRTHTPRSGDFDATSILYRHGGRTRGAGCGLFSSNVGIFDHPLVLVV